MRRIVGVCMMVTLVLASMPFVVADDGEQEQVDVVIDEKTRDETRTMLYQYGASIRLLQLEKAILKSIIKGEMIISVLNDIGVNTTGLECIVAEMRILLDEVRSVDVNSTNSTQVFVDLKYDAILLVKEFRDTLRGLVGNDVLGELKERIRDANTTGVHNITLRIRHRVRLYNRNQLYRICQMTGWNLSIPDDYLNGSITIDELRNKFSRMINQLSREEKRRLFYELKEDNVRSDVRNREVIEEAKRMFHERRQHRLNNRLMLVEGSDGMYARIKTRLQERFKGEMEGKGKGGGGK